MTVCQHRSGWQKRKNIQGFGGYIKDRPTDIHRKELPVLKDIKPNN